MSDSPKMPLSVAMAAAAALFRAWTMQAPACEVLGSVRRQKPEVGDLDLLAPLPVDAKKDPLYEAIDATCLRTSDLFPRDTAFCTEVRGVKPGFRTCQVIAQLGVGEGGAMREINVQVFRYTVLNRGWQRIMRTGPEDFGIWFLAKWKERFGIVREKEASIDGHLVDQWGKVVAVPDEAAAFHACGISFVPPNLRSDWSEHLKRRAAASREVLR